MVNLKTYFAWAFKRYQLGYQIMAIGIAMVNFGAIFSIFFEDLMPRYLSFPLLLIGGSIALGVFSWFIVDYLKMQNLFLEKEGKMSDYWESRINPVTQKQLILLLEAIEDKEKINDLKERIKSGYL